MDKNPDLPCKKLWFRGSSLFNKRYPSTNQFAVMRAVTWRVCPSLQGNGFIYLSTMLYYLGYSYRDVEDTLLPDEKDLGYTDTQQVSIQFYPGPDILEIDNLIPIPLGKFEIVHIDVYRKVFTDPKTDFIPMKTIYR